jgi:ABC-2 type transport system permease protein
MSAADHPSNPPLSAQPSPSPGRTLRRLFLTLFLRGRSSRGLQKQNAPSSVGQKLSLTLLLYALFGMLALTFHGQTVFALSIYLHGLTFIFLGMFVASSAGEILFNKDEADILLHRPISPRALLWAKVAVLVEVSLWLSGALNLGGVFVGLTGAGGSPFVVAHAISITLEAIFCTSCVVMVYQLCLRWFGRERLEGLMTTAQVLIAVGAMLSGQILPRIHLEQMVRLSEAAWWIVLLPPAWFAGIDDALAGSGAATSWLLAGLGVLATIVVVWIAFGKLAQNYATGLQILNETVSRRSPHQAQRRWVNALVETPPLCWWLRDPIERASFLLAAAYLLRDRDVKLRVYPGIAPMMILPFCFMLPAAGRGLVGSSGFGISFAGGYLGLIPLLGISMLQYSQQWQASDIFRAAPIFGPGPICRGARRAILCLLTFPAVVAFALFAAVILPDKSHLLLLLPGVIALPVFALLANLGGKGVPLSMPNEEAKSAGRAMLMIGIIPIVLAISALTSWAWSSGFFWWFVAFETMVVIALQAVLNSSIARVQWPSEDA